MKLSKFKISLLFVAIFGVLSVGIAIAQVPPSGSGDNTPSTPPIGDGSNTGGTTPPPPAGNDSNTGGTTPPPPSGNGSNTGGTTPPPPSGNGSNTGGTGNSPSNPPTSPIIINYGGNGAPISLPSFSGVVGGGFGGGVINPNPSITPGTSFACNPYINRYMTFGANNDYDEVVKLQIFLKDVEHLNVDVTGKYDLKTFEAVKAFQQRYSDDVLKRSWGISTPTGIVFFTTRLKINDIYCRTSTNFSTLNLPRIVFNQNVNNGEANTNGNQTTPNVIELPLPGEEPSTIPSELIGQNEPTNSIDGSGNVAAVGKSGIRRFFDSVGDFFNRIFGSKGPATTTTTTTVTSTTTTEVETSGDKK